MMQEHKQELQEAQSSLSPPSQGKGQQLGFQVVALMQINANRWIIMVIAHIQPQGIGKPVSLSPGKVK